MKKILVSIAVVLLLCLLGSVFVACSNVNQINFIHVVSRDVEHFTYTVQWVDKDATTGAETTTDIGTMQLSFHRLGGQASTVYKVDSHDFEITSGGVIETKVDITAGEYQGDSVYSVVLFEGAFSPVASYKVYHAEGDEARSYTSFIDYVSTKKKAAISINGEEATYFKIPSYCYDNDSLYFLVRGSDVGQASYSLSVAGVDNLQGGTRSVSIAKEASLQPVVVPAIPQSVDAYRVYLSAASTYGNGTTTSIYFLQSYRHTDLAGISVDINKLPVRIDEGNVRYVLSSVSTDDE